MRAEREIESVSNTRLLLASTNALLLTLPVALGLFWKGL